MIPNHYIQNGCFTKHPLKTGCLGYQDGIHVFSWFQMVIVMIKLQAFPTKTTNLEPEATTFFSWQGFQLEDEPHLYVEHRVFHQRSIYHLTFGCLGFQAFHPLQRRFLSKKLGLIIPWRSFFARRVYVQGLLYVMSCSFFGWLFKILPFFKGDAQKEDG